MHFPYLVQIGICTALFGSVVGLKGYDIVLLVSMPNITCSDGQTDKPHAKHNLFRWTNRQTPCET